MSTTQLMRMIAASQFILLLAGPANAASQSDYSDCIQNIDQNHRIVGCTAILSDAMETRVNRASAYVNRGNAYLTKNDADRAIADYDEALQLDPKHVAAHNNRGSAYQTKGDIEDAIADYNAAIRLDFQYTQAYVNRGSAYQTKGETKNAIADYGMALQLDPKRASTYNYRGIVYRYAGPLDQAQADFRQAVALDSKNAYYALWFDIVERRADQSSHLAQAAQQFDAREWPAPLVKFFLGEMTQVEMLSAANAQDPDVTRGQICEAHFYAAEFASLRHRKDEALRLYRLAATDCPKGFVEWGAALAAIKELNPTQ